MKTKTRILIALFAGIISVKALPTAEEMKTWQLLPHTQSPNGKLGLIYPTREQAINETSPHLVLVALPSRAPIVEIPVGASNLILNHGACFVNWTKNSDFALIYQGIKWGPDKVLLLETTGGIPKITDLTKKVRAILDPHFLNSNAAPFNEYFHFIFDMGLQGIVDQNQLVGDKGWKLMPNGDVKIDCTCTNDPKQMDPNRWAVRWTGTWDTATQKFVNGKIQKIP